MILINMFFLKVIFTDPIDSKDFYQIEQQLPNQKITLENGKYYLECDKQEYDVGFRNIYVEAIAFQSKNNNFFDTYKFVKFFDLELYFVKNVSAVGVHFCLQKCDDNKISFTKEEIYTSILENGPILVPQIFLQYPTVTKKVLEGLLKKYNTFKINLSEFFENRLKFLFRYCDINSKTYYLFNFYGHKINHPNAILEFLPIEITKLNEDKFDFKLIHFNVDTNEIEEYPNIKPIVEEEILLESDVIQLNTDLQTN